MNETIFALLLGAALGALLASLVVIELWYRRKIDRTCEEYRLCVLWLHLGGCGRKQMAAAIREVPELASWRNVLREWRARDAD